MPDNPVEPSLFAKGSDAPEAVIRESPDCAKSRGSLPSPDLSLQAGAIRRCAFCAKYLVTLSPSGYIIASCG